MFEYFLKFTTYFIYYLLFFGLFLKMMFPNHYFSIKVIRNIVFSLLLLSLFFAFYFNYSGFLYFLNDWHFLLSFFLLGGVVFFALNFIFYQNLFFRDIFKFLLLMIVLMGFPYVFLYNSSDVKIRYHMKQNVVDFIMTMNDIKFLANEPNAILKPKNYDIRYAAPLIKKAFSKKMFSDEILLLNEANYRFSKNITNELSVMKVEKNSWDKDFSLKNYDEGLYFVLFNNAFKNDHEKPSYVGNNQIFVKGCRYVLNKINCQFVYSHKNSSPVLVEFFGASVDLDNSVLSCREIYDANREIRRSFYSDDNFNTIIAFKDDGCHKDDSKVIKRFYNNKEFLNQNEAKEKNVFFVKEKGIFFMVSKYNEALALRTKW